MPLPASSQEQSFGLVVAMIRLPLAIRRSGSTASSLQILAGQRMQRNQVRFDDAAQAAGFGQFPAGTQDAALGRVMHGMDTQIAAAAALFDDTDLLDQAGSFSQFLAQTGQQRSRSAWSAARIAVPSSAGGLGHHQGVARPDRRWPG